MKKTIKCILSACLCVALILQLVSCKASLLKENIDKPTDVPQEEIIHNREWLSSADSVIAYGGDCGEKSEWQLSQSGILTVSGSGSVKAVGDGFDESIFADVKNIIIENGITEIQKGAFAKIKESNFITLPNSLKKIGSENFYGVKYVKIPEGVETIDKNAFSARENTSEDSRVCTAFLPGGVEQEKKYDKDFFAGNSRNVYSPNKLVVSSQVDYERYFHAFNWSESDLKTAWVYLDGNAVESIPDDAYKIKLTNASVNGVKNKRTDINSIAFKESTIYSLDLTDLGTSFESVSFIDSRVRLSGFKGVVSAKNLLLSNMYFDDFEWLAHFKNLKNIHINSCSFGSTAGLEKLETVENLAVTGCFLDNLDFVKGLKNLKYLDLGTTSVGDASGLADSKITQLNFSSNPSPFLDLSCLTKMPKLANILVDSFELGLDADIISYFKKYMKSYSPSEDYDLPGFHDYAETDSYNAKKQIRKTLENITLPNMADGKKLENIVDFVIDKLDYDYNSISGLSENNTGDYNSRLLYYAFEGIGVCANYAALTTSLLNEAGIDAYYVSGSSHAWVCAKLENDYYWIDPTNLDQPGYYFDANIALKHVEYMLNYNEYVPSALPQGVYCKLAKINPPSSAIEIDTNI